jgi:hypothetical protein
VGITHPLSNVLRDVYSPPATDPLKIFEAAMTKELVALTR